MRHFFSCKRNIATLPQGINPKLYAWGRQAWMSLRKTLCIDEQEEHHQRCLLEEKLYKHSHASIQWQKHSSSSCNFHNMVIVSVSTHLQEKKTTLPVQHVIYIPQPMSMCRGNVGSANKVSHTGGVTGTWWCTKEEVLDTAAATLNLQVRMLTCMTEELEKNTKSLSHSKLSNVKSGLLQMFQNRFKPKIAATWGTITAYRRRDCYCFLLQFCALQWEML